MNDAPSSGASGLADLHPACFSMAMATGIVSIASQLLGYRPIAVALFALTLAIYVVLCALTIARIVKYRHRVIGDVQDHGRSVGFFTVVAATCVLGSDGLIVAGMWRAAAALWVAGIVLWAISTYTIFTVLTVKAVKPSLAEGMNGGWLVSVVAAQSVCVLGAQLAPGFGTYEPQVLFLSLAMWLGGGMLYIWIISLIFYRYAFFTLSPADLAPPYWVNMGAVAISALAGSLLVLDAPRSRLLQSLEPFLRGLTLLFWATATWWIPMLVILGIWRHVYRRFPLRYDPLYWGAVFPLGMYTASTLRLAQAIDAPYLMVIPRVFIAIAWAAWIATAVGFIATVSRARSR